MDSIKAIVVALVIIAGGSYAYKAITVERQVASITSAAERPSSTPLLTDAEARAEWMSGCNDPTITGMTEYCTCSYNEIRETYSINEMINFGVTLDQAGFETKFAREIETCLNRVYPSL